jgi:hypothetical protein
MATNRKAVRIKKIARQQATREKNRPRKHRERVRKAAAATVRTERLAAKAKAAGV